MTGPGVSVSLSWKWIPPGMSTLNRWHFWCFVIVSLFHAITVAVLNTLPLYSSGMLPPMSVIRCCLASSANMAMEGLSMRSIFEMD